MNVTKESNSYETICIIKPDLNEDNLAKVIEKYQLLLAEKGAKDISNNSGVVKTGKPKLAKKGWK